MKLHSNRFNLLLGGGAAFGYAHIGVLEALEEFGLVPFAYHGVSMGAIVASVAALEGSFSTKMELFSQVFGSLGWIRLRLRSSLIGTQKIEDLLDTIFGSKKISQLSKPLFIHAVSFQDGKERVFGPTCDVTIKDAILASMAVPGVFPPKEIAGEVYVDGYLKCNIPLSSVQNDYTNLIVNVTGRNSIKSLTNEELKELSLFSNLERSIRLLIYNQITDALKHFQHPYILIEPDTAPFKTASFHKFETIRQLGYESAIEVIKGYL